MTTVDVSAGGRVTELVQRILAERSITRAFTPHDDLRDVGLTSLDMVNLVLAVESALAIAIPESAITPANFRSVATIESLVRGLHG